MHTRSCHDWVLHLFKSLLFSVPANTQDSMETLPREDGEIMKGEEILPKNRLEDLKSGSVLKPHKDTKPTRRKQVLGQSTYSTIVSFSPHFACPCISFNRFYSNSQFGHRLVFNFLFCFFVSYNFCHSYWNLHNLDKNNRLYFQVLYSYLSFSQFYVMYCSTSIVQKQTSKCSLNLVYLSDSFDLLYFTKDVSKVHIILILLNSVGTVFTDHFTACPADFWVMNFNINSIVQYFHSCSTEKLALLIIQEHVHI